jgi:hypothetical protein
MMARFAGPSYHEGNGSSAADAAWANASPRLTVSNAQTTFLGVFMNASGVWIVTPQLVF